MSIADDLRKEGYEEGYKEGFRKGYEKVVKGEYRTELEKKVVTNFLKDGVKSEEISKKTGIDLKRVLEIEKDLDE